MHFYHCCKKGNALNSDIDIFHGRSFNETVSNKIFKGFLLEINISEDSQKIPKSGSTTYFQKRMKDEEKNENTHTHKTPSHMKPQRRRGANKEKTATEELPWSGP